MQETVLFLSQHVSRKKSLKFVSNLKNHPLACMQNYDCIKKLGIYPEYQSPFSRKKSKSVSAGRFSFAANSDHLQAL